MGSGTEGYCTISAAPRQPRSRLLRLLERRPLGRELELARQRLERQLPGAPSQVSLFSSDIRKLADRGSFFLWYALDPFPKHISYGNEFL